MKALTIKWSALALITLTPGLALAHHPLGGETPDTLWHGMLSGLAHPFIGAAHLLFILAAGLLLAALKSNPLPKIALFLTATLAGAAWQLMHWPMFSAHSLLALSVVAAGLLLIKRQQAGTAIMVLAGLAGLVHGFVYAEAIIGSRTGPMATYLVGFTLIQGLMLAGICQAGRVLMAKSSPQTVLRFQRAGGLLVVAGGVLLF